MNAKPNVDAITNSVNDVLRHLGQHNLSTEEKAAALLVALAITAAGRPDIAGESVKTLVAMFGLDERALSAQAKRQIEIRLAHFMPCFNCWTDCVGAIGLKQLTGQAVGHCEHQGFGFSITAAQGDVLGWQVEAISKESLTARFDEEGASKPRAH